jgi:Ricin-type beta-trefoil lectin domain-like
MIKLKFMKKTTLFLLSIFCFPFSKTYAINGVFSIVLENGKALDADAGNVNNNDCTVQIWDYIYNSPNQKWNIQDLGGGRHRITCVASGKALDANMPHLMPTWTHPKNRFFI